MATLFVWDPHDGWGHAALKLSSPFYYISWWPTRDVVGDPKKVLGARCKGAPSFSEHEDIAVEGRPAEHQLEFALYEPAVIGWWEQFVIGGSDWSTLELNCARVVLQAIEAGLGFGSLPFWKRFRFVTWSPADLVDLVRDIREATNYKAAPQNQPSQAMAL